MDSSNRNKAENEFVCKHLIHFLFVSAILNFTKFFHNKKTIYAQNNIKISNKQNAALVEIIQPASKIGSDEFP